ncbi:MAG: hypothetical protein ABIG42_06090 [bacterium]
MRNNGKKPRILQPIPFLIGFAFAILYASFLSKMHYIDGLAFAYYLENYPADYLWHQHHPVWLPLMKIIFSLLKALFPELRSLIFLSVMNAILGGLVVALLIQLLLKITKNPAISILTGILFGVSWGMMNFSTDSNIYILIVMLMILITILLVSGENLSRKNAVLATVLILISSLMHQISFFYSFVVLAAIVLRSPKKERYGTLGICTIIYAIAIVSVNYIIYQHSMSLLNGEIMLSFPEWLTAYGREIGWWTPIAKGTDYGMQILCYTLFNSIFHTQGSELLRHARPYDESLFNPAFYLLYALIVISIFWEIYFCFRSPYSDKKVRDAQSIFLIWFLLYFLFNHLFCPFELHYKLFYIPPLLGLWSIRLSGISTTKKMLFSIVAITVVSFMILLNFFTGMLPNSKFQTNPFLKSVFDIAEITQEGDLVIFARNQFYSSGLTRYYSKADAEVYRNKFNKFVVVEKNQWEIETQTVNFLNKHYDRIFLTDQAYSDLTKFGIWYFSGYYFPLPHPWALAVSTSSIKKIGDIEVRNGEVLHEVKLISETYSN